MEVNECAISLELLEFKVVNDHKYQDHHKREAFLLRYLEEWKFFQQERVALNIQQVEQSVKYMMTQDREIFWRETTQQFFTWVEESIGKLFFSHEWITRVLSYQVSFWFSEKYGIEEAA